MGVVVACRQHGAPGERLDRKRAVGRQRDGEDDEVAERGRLGRSAGLRFPAELSNKFAQRLWTARVRYQDFMTRGYREARDPGADRACADDSEARHVVLLSSSAELTAPL